jgi:hypothetical protein
LLGNISAKNLFNLNKDLTENLTFKMNEYAMRKLDRHYGEKVEDATRSWERAFDRMREQGPDMDAINLRRGRGGSSGGSSSRGGGDHAINMADDMCCDDRGCHPCGMDNMDMDRPRPRRMREEEFLLKYLSKVTQEELGWTLEDKFNALKANDQRYEELYNQIASSQEVANGMEFAMNLPKNKQIKKLAHEIEWFAEDNLDDRGWRYRMSEIRERPSDEERRNMGRDEEEMKSIEGVHIENDDIKDVFEDAEYLANEIGDFMDPENPLMAEAIKLDA